EAGRVAAAGPGAALMCRARRGGGKKNPPRREARPRPPGGGGGGEAAAGEEEEKEEARSRRKGGDRGIACSLIVGRRRALEVPRGPPLGKSRRSVPPEEGQRHQPGLRPPRRLGR
ncbi:unnamed protein product, partial [Prorocentrum cordatum]